MRRGRVHLARRLVVLTVISIIALIALATTEPFGGASARAATTGSPSVSHPSTVARDGDTMWSIARRLGHTDDIAGFVDEMVRLNGGPSLQPGQTVVLP